MPCGGGDDRVTPRPFTAPFVDIVTCCIEDDNRCDVSELLSMECLFSSQIISKAIIPAGWLTMADAVQIQSPKLGQESVGRSATEVPSTRRGAGIFPRCGHQFCGRNSSVCLVFASLSKVSLDYTHHDTSCMKPGRVSAMASTKRSRSTTLLTLSSCPLHYLAFGLACKDGLRT